MIVLFAGVGLVLGHILLFNELQEFIPSAFPRMPTISKHLMMQSTIFDVSPTGSYFITNLVLAVLAVILSAINANIWSQSLQRKPVPSVVRSVRSLGSKLADLAPIVLSLPGVPWSAWSSAVHPPR
jgi:hypothetical protein